MATTYPALLQTHQTSLAAKNKEQSKYMKRIKKITDANKAHYQELYSYISQIATKGKLLIKGNIIRDECNISKYLSKMRSNKGRNNNKSGENN